MKKKLKKLSGIVMDYTWPETDSKNDDDVILHIKTDKDEICTFNWTKLIHESCAGHFPCKGERINLRFHKRKETSYERPAIERNQPLQHFTRYAVCPLAEWHGNQIRKYYEEEMNREKIQLEKLMPVADVENDPIFYDSDFENIQHYTAQNGLSYPYKDEYLRFLKDPNTSFALCTAGTGSGKSYAAIGASNDVFKKTGKGSVFVTPLRATRDLWMNEAYSILANEKVRPKILKLSAKMDMIKDFIDIYAAGNTFRHADLIKSRLPQENIILHSLPDLLTDMAAKYNVYKSSSEYTGTDAMNDDEIELVDSLKAKVFGLHAQITRSIIRYIRQHYNDLAELKKKDAEENNKPKESVDFDALYKEDLERAWNRAICHDRASVDQALPKNDSFEEWLPFLCQINPNLLLPATDWIFVTPTRLTYSFRTPFHNYDRLILSPEILSKAIWFDELPESTVYIQNALIKQSIDAAKNISAMYIELEKQLRCIIERQPEKRLDAWNTVPDWDSRVRNKSNANLKLINAAYNLVDPEATQCEPPTFYENEPDSTFLWYRYLFTDDEKEVITKYGGSLHFYGNPVERKYLTLRAKGKKLSLNALPDKEKTVFLLNEKEGLSPKQITMRMLRLIRNAIQIITYDVLPFVYADHFPEFKKRGFRDMENERPLQRLGQYLRMLIQTKQEDAEKINRLFESAFRKVLDCDHIEYSEQSDAFKSLESIAYEYWRLEIETPFQANALQRPNADNFAELGLFWQDAFINPYDLHYENGCRMNYRFYELNESPENIITQCLNLQKNLKIMFISATGHLPALTNLDMERLIERFPDRYWDDWNEEKLTEFMQKRYEFFDCENNMQISNDGFYSLPPDLSLEIIKMLIEKKQPQRTESTKNKSDEELLAPCLNGPLGQLAYAYYQFLLHDQPDDSYVAASLFCALKKLAPYKPPKDESENVSQQYYDLETTCDVVDLILTYFNRQYPGRLNIDDLLVPSNWQKNSHSFSKRDKEKYYPFLILHNDDQCLEAKMKCVNERHQQNKRTFLITAYKTFSVGFNLTMNITKKDVPSLLKINQADHSLTKVSINAITLCTPTNFLQNSAMQKSIMTTSETEAAMIFYNQINRLYLRHSITRSDRSQLISRRYQDLASQLYGFPEYVYYCLDILMQILGRLERTPIRYKTTYINIQPELSERLSNCPSGALIPDLLESASPFVKTVVERLLDNAVKPEISKRITKKMKKASSCYFSICDHPFDMSEDEKVRYLHFCEDLIKNPPVLTKEKWESIENQDVKNCYVSCKHMEKLDGKNKNRLFYHRNENETAFYWSGLGQLPAYKAKIYDPFELCGLHLCADMLDHSERSDLLNEIRDEIYNRNLMKNKKFEFKGDAEWYLLDPETCAKYRGTLGEELTRIWLRQLYPNIAVLSENNTDSSFEKFDFYVQDPGYTKIAMDVKSYSYIHQTEAYEDLLNKYRERLEEQNLKAGIIFQLLPYPGFDAKKMIPETETTLAPEHFVEWIGPMYSETGQLYPKQLDRLHDVLHMRSDIDI